MVVKFFESANVIAREYKIPKSYFGGTYISDFAIENEDRKDEISPVPPSSDPSDPPDPSPSEVPAEVPRLYANQRGRKAAARDAQDLVVAYQTGGDLIVFLQKC